MKIARLFQVGWLKRAQGMWESRDIPAWHEGRNRGGNPGGRVSLQCEADHNCNYDQLSYMSMNIPEGWNVLQARGR